MRKHAIFIMAAVVLCSLAVALALNPLRPSSVAIAVGAIETDCYRDSSLVAVRVTITNSSPAQMAFDTTYQTKTPSGWERPSTIKTWYVSPNDDRAPVQPFTARTVHVPVPGRTEAPWRVVVRCTGTYKASTPFERFRLNAYLFVFRREPSRYFVSGEHPANKALHATAAAPSS
jgi:hypothetical protein